MTEYAIEAEGLVKSFHGTTVLAGVDLRVPRGGVFALLGPNGAGKTTTVRILATLLRPDAGTAHVAGLDVCRQAAQVRRRLSLTGQHVAVDDLQTGAENLRMMGRLRGLSGPAARARADTLLERFDLVVAANRRVATYSGGMRRRLDLAAGLVSGPEVLFLDEPTTGLDPRSRAGLWDVVRELTGAGVTVLLTTQYLEEADQLADRIAVIDGGHIVAKGTARELKARVSAGRLRLRASGPVAYEQLRHRLGQQIVLEDAATWTLAVACDGGPSGSAVAVRGLLDRADPDRSAIASFELQEATLDDAFLALTGRAASVSSTEASGV